MAIEHSPKPKTTGPQPPRGAAPPPLDSEADAEDLDDERSQRSEPRDSTTPNDAPTNLQELIEAFNQERAKAHQRDELIQALIDENASLRERPATRAEVSRDPRVPSPPEFTGKVSEFRNFMAQCTLTFAMCPNTYAKNYQKVLFVIALLRGTPLDWARPVAENANHPFYNDYAAFKNALSNIYLDRNVNAASRDKLSTLQQTGSAAAYAVEFQSLTASLGLGDPALCLLFYEKLKPAVKDALALVGQAATFHALVDQVICIDQRQFQRKKEEKKNNPQLKPTTPNPVSGKPQSNDKPTGNSNPRYNTPAPSNSRSTTPRTSSTAPSSTPAYTPRDPATEAEWQRRRSLGLCTSCGEKGHFRTDCPRKPRPSASVSTSNFTIPQPMPRTPHPPENWQSQTP